MKKTTIGIRGRVAVVDDDEDTRLCFQDILQSSGAFEFVGGFSSGAEAIAGLPRLRPDLILMDIQLPDRNGIECAKRLRQILPFLKIIIVTGTHEVRSAADSRLAGAAGYLAKPVVSEQLLSTLIFVSTSAVEAGEQVLPPVKARRTTLLNARQQQVMQCFAEGLYYKEIPDKLGISETAFRKCQHKIFALLKVGSRTEAVSVWLQNGGRTSS